jgi:hypothetical protein
MNGEPMDLDGFEDDFAAFGEPEYDEAEDADTSLEMKQLLARVQAAGCCA